MKIDKIFQYVNRWMITGFLLSFPYLCLNARCAMALTAEDSPIDNNASITYTANGNTRALASNLTQDTVIFMPYFSSLPDLTSDTGGNGAVITISETITNIGNGVDTYTISAVNDHAYTVKILSDTGTVISTSSPLLAGETFPFIVKIIIPGGAPAGEISYTTSTVTSYRNVGMDTISVHSVAVDTSLSPVDNFQVVLPASISSGVPFELSITAVDTQSNTIASYNAVVNLTVNIGSIVPTNLSVVNGSGTASITLTGGAGVYFITADNGSLSGISNPAVISATGSGTESIYIVDKVYYQTQKIVYDDTDVLIYVRVPGYDTATAFISANGAKLNLNTIDSVVFVYQPPYLLWQNIDVTQLFTGDTALTNGDIVTFEVKNDSFGTLMDTGVTYIPAMAPLASYTRNFPDGTRIDLKDSFRDTPVLFTIVEINNSDTVYDISNEAFSGQENIISIGAGIYRFFLEDIYGNDIHDFLDKTITIYVPYPVTVNAATENNLVLLRLDEANRKWKIEAGAKIDARKKHLHNEEDHFTIFTVGAILSQNLDSLEIYPNPFTPGSNVSGDGLMKFMNIPDNVHLMIYDISGHKVLDREIRDTSGGFTWDMTNISGRPLASGVYLYILRDYQGHVRHGKIAIVR